MKETERHNPETGDKWEVQLRKGCLELAILAALWDANLYGLEIPRRHNLSVTQPTQDARTSGKRMGGVGSRTPAEILRAYPRRKTANSRDDGNLDAVFIEDEQITCSRREGKVDDRFNR
jgi:hypothetical protein